MMKIILTVFFISLSLFAQNIIPISNLRMNDANGLPVYMDSIVTVTGIVTVSNQFGSTGGPASIQDATAGISVYGSNFSNFVSIGDSVTITSKVTHFNGLTQFNYSTATGSSFTKHSTNKTVTPIVLTIAEILGQQWNGFEEYESQLIRINNITISATGNFASGTNYNITDGTGTLQLRVDNDVTSIIGTPIPSGAIDVIGVLGQFDSSPPHSSGYQIIPRFIQDLQFDGSPQIYGTVLASNITQTSFSVYFQTARKGNTVIKYGRTTALELDSVVTNIDTTLHIITVSGLQPSTKYYYRAISRNNVGESQSGLQSVTTASNDPQIGKIEAYFNYPVDTSVAIPGNSAQGNVDFQSKLVEKITAATYSIDMAVYSFNGLHDVTAALLNAKNRGVKIRVVYDSRATQASMQELVNAGIPIIKRPTTDGIMHNKFFIFDARDTVSGNDLVWTGSYNITSTELNWKNNVVTIADPAIAQAYMTEFEEMWGSSSDTPNLSAARFGSSKLDNTQHIFTVGGKEVLLYFSPSDLTTTRIVSALNTANYAIYFALYTFTKNEPATAIKNRYDAGANSIRGIINQVNDNGSEYPFLATFAEMFGNTSIGTLHHKYAMVDPAHPESNPLVITGSHNWSTSAETKNDENTLIIKDIYTANKFMQEFKKRYNDVGGTGTFIIPTVNVEEKVPVKEAFRVFPNYPNPFQSITTIRIDIEKASKLKVEIFDAIGRKINTIFDREVEKGLVVIDVDANSSPLNLSSGAYYYRVTGLDQVFTGKMLVIR